MSIEEKKDNNYLTDVEVMRPEADLVEDKVTQEELNATSADLAMAAEKLDSMTLERCKAIMTQVLEMHQYDQNFPSSSLDAIKDLLENPDVTANPDKHAELIHAMKLEALLVTENSPYAEVRAVVDNTDDPTMPSLTFRVWVIGIVFAGAGAFINQLFSIRQPQVYVSSQVAQLLAWPFGKLMERTMPHKEFNFFGRHSLNPGPFNKKEHMLITIMATVAFNTPYTGYIVFTQALPQYFGQSYAKDFGYQILNTIGSNFVGYGLAGLCRRFIVYPSFCVWPSSLTSLAINKAFHSDDSIAVPGPLKRIYTWSRMKLFMMAFVSMFIYWWFPGYIFQALSTFNWLSWIAPNNMAFNNIVGMNNGLGLNPLPTFDFNVPSFNGWTPLVIPLFSVMNQWVGMCLGFFMIIGIYWTNKWDTAYLPINSNKVFANDGSRYNVTKILNDDGIFDNEKYQVYSEPYMSAANITVYFWFFALYTATISYTALYHRHELASGFRGFWRSVKKTFKKGDGQFGDDDEDLGEDIHFRLMRSYKEVPEWCYFIVLLVALGIGCAGVGAYPTNTSPAVVVFGIIMAILFVIPIGLIAAVTGVQVTLNVLAEFIGGGGFAVGDALAMNYFKMYGYIVTAQAIYFANDLKLAHYVKIPPKHTFAAQMVATVVSTFVCTGIFNYQMSFKNVCTSDAQFAMSCPGENTFFTAAVFWGTLGPQKLFGPGGRYKLMLLGFPIGFVLPIITWLLSKKFPRNKWIRSFHPVMFCYGPIMFAPYNLSYMWPMVMLTWFSWGYIKPRYLAFWSRYNYVLAAAWSAAIAIAAIVIFFAVQIPDVSIDWWGNNVPYQGCENAACVLLEIPEKGYFGREPGTYN